MFFITKSITFDSVNPSCFAAIVTGIVAKEVVVSTMGVLYGVGDEESENPFTTRKGIFVFVCIFPFLDILNYNAFSNFLK